MISPITTDDSPLIGRINFQSKNLHRQVFSIILACIYSWVTIATSTDLQIVAGNVDFTLPVISAKVSPPFFFIFTPILLVVLYFYSLLCLFRLAEDVSMLNIAQPTGRYMDDHLHSIVLSGMIRVNTRKIKERKRIFSQLQYFSIICSVWLVVPSTLIYFWIRYLTNHDFVLSLFHCILLTLSSGFGYLFYLCVVKQLREELPNDFSWSKSIKLLQLIPILAISIFFLLSVVIVTYSTRILSSPLFVRADLSEQDISQRPLGWVISDGYESVIGAKLEGADFRGVEINNSFLAKADLRRAKCSKMTSRNSRFALSNLESADLSECVFEDVDLSQCHLMNANFQNSVLYSCNLNSASLFETDFTGATLFECSLSTEFPFSAKFDSANVQFSVFQSLLGQGLEATKIRNASNWPLAYFDKSALKTLKLPDNHNERLKKNDLSEYRFHDVDFIQARFGNMSLQNTIFMGVNLSEASFFGSELSGALFFHCNFARVRLTYANIQGANFIDAGNLDPTAVRQAKNWPFAFFSNEILDSLEFPQNHNSLLKNKRLVNYDLSGCFISEININHFEFDSSNFRTTTIFASSCDSCSFRYASLDSSDLAGSSFRGAKFISASLRGADVRNADLSYANLSRADFRGAILSGVNFTGAKMDSTDFRGAIFIDFQGINEVQAANMMIDSTTMLPGNKLTNLADLPDSILRKVLIESTLEKDE